MPMPFPCWEGHGFHAFKRLVTLNEVTHVVLVKGTPLAARLQKTGVV